MDLAKFDQKLTPLQMLRNKSLTNSSDKSSIDIELVLENFQPANISQISSPHQPIQKSKSLYDTLDHDNLTNNLMKISSIKKSENSDADIKMPSNADNTIQTSQLQAKLKQIKDQEPVSEIQKMKLSNQGCSRQNSINLLHSINNRLINLNEIQEYCYNSLQKLDQQHQQQSQNSKCMPKSTTSTKRKLEFQKSFEMREPIIRTKSLDIKHFTPDGTFKRLTTVDPNFFKENALNTEFANHRPRLKRSITPRNLSFKDQSKSNTNLASKLSLSRMKSSPLKLKNKSKSNLSDFKIIKTCRQEVKTCAERQENSSLKDDLSIFSNEELNEPIIPYDLVGLNSTNPVCQEHQELFRNKSTLTPSAKALKNLALLSNFPKEFNYDKNNNKKSINKSKDTKKKSLTGTKSLTLGFSEKVNTGSEFGRNVLTYFF